MDLVKLTRMSNEIAAFFRAYPEEEAVAGIRDHIKAFWTPRMRASLALAVPGDLDPLVAKALRGVPHAESPVGKATAGPEAVGQLASDAG